MNASSFSRFTGMLISSAASASSRSARQARPVRELLMNAQRDDDDREAPSDEVEVAA